MVLFNCFLLGSISSQLWTSFVISDKWIDITSYLLRNHVHDHRVNCDFVNKLSAIANEPITPTGGFACPIAFCMQKIIVTRAHTWVNIILLLITLMIKDDIECSKVENDLYRLAWYRTPLYSSRFNRNKKKLKNTFFFALLFFFLVSSYSYWSIWAALYLPMRRNLNE